MRRYEKYKPSGIDWIGDIPETWHIKRLKDFTQKILGGGTPTTGIDRYWDDEKITGIPWVAIADITKAEIIVDTDKFITNEGLESSSAQIIEKGKILYSIYASLGKVAVAGRELTTNQAILSIYENPILSNVNYLKYCLKGIEDIVGGIGSSTTQNNISLEKLRTIKFPLPELDEQLTISNYLDHQTQKIDCLIANKKAQAEKLKELRQIEINNAVTKGLNPNAEFKDSGIDWLGKIPGHWKYKRLKDIANVVLGKMLQNDDSGSDELLPYLRSFNVQWEKVDLSDVKEMWFSENEKKQYRLKENDIVVSEGGEVGRSALWSNEIPECYIQNSVHKISCYKIILPNYLLYHFTLLGKVGVFDMLINKVSIGHLTREKLVCVSFLLPPLEEQRQIADYLLKRTTSIDKLVNNIDSQIEKLQELRKITIYEAVTGKIKVDSYASTTT